MPTAALAVVDEAWTRADVTPGAYRYAVHLAGYADADGLTYVARSTSARILRVTERTITRWRAELERARIILREDGGWRGMTTVMRVLTRVTKSAANRAKAAGHAAYRARNTQRLPSCRPKGDMWRPPTIPSREGSDDGAASGGLRVASCELDLDEYGHSCQRCGLPAGNRVHR